MQGHIKQHKLGAEVKVGKRTDTDQSSASPFPLGNTKYLLWFGISSKFKLTFVWRTSHTPPNPYGVLGGRVPSGMGRSRDSSPSRSPTAQERTSISQTYLTSKIYFLQSWWITGILGFEGWGIGIFFVCVCIFWKHCLPFIMPSSSISCTQCSPKQNISHSWKIAELSSLVSLTSKKTQARHGLCPRWIQVTNATI